MKLAKKAVTMQRRLLFNEEKSGAEMQAKINRIRSELPHDYQWLADAMWTEGRRSTLSEIIAQDPYSREESLDRKIAERTHPLHHGIRAAFEARQAVIRKKAEANSRDDLKYDLPEGLTTLQRRVFIE
eukprot:TRINITY_DN2632_c0_g3_i3.p1 TRINITY_DN2632_c0_g3~~TRINITY_DN2632_c0_g3_i3.p1  ORF type:complete len:143 (+),score=33.17 TRINITY_DN2632_c0_g3_i3:47-430(+)